MHNGLRIGVGILTCNRELFFKKQLEELLLAKESGIVDDIIVVKNKEFDYPTFDHNNEAYEYVNVKEDVGIGFCKNVALKYLMSKDCDHLFLIEDDIKIKDIEVFKRYIDVAKTFKLEHLIFGSVYTPPTWEIDKIICSVKADDGNIIDMYANLHGGFVYFTKKCIQYCGLFDEEYINAVEHIDHTYRIVNFGFYTPFWTFADIHDSSKYLEDSLPDNPSTINNNELKKIRTFNGFTKFKNTWNINVKDIPRPTTGILQEFFNKRSNKNV